MDFGGLAVRVSFRTPAAGRSSFHGRPFRRTGRIGTASRSRMAAWQRHVSGLRQRSRCRAVRPRGPDRATPAGPGCRPAEVSDLIPEPCPAPACNGLRPRFAKAVRSLRLQRVHPRTAMDPACGLVRRRWAVIRAGKGHRSRIARSGPALQPQSQPGLTPRNVGQLGVRTDAYLPDGGHAGTVAPARPKLREQPGSAAPYASNDRGQARQI